MQWHYMQPLISKKPSTVIIHIGTNDAGIKGAAADKIIDSLLELKKEFDTKLDEKYPEELNDITGIQQVHLNRTCNGGGVSIYIRESIEFRTRTNVPKNDLELICIEIEQPKSKPFLVLAWYKSPSAPVDILEKVISYFDRKGKEIIFLGDTNCDSTTIKQNVPVNGGQFKTHLPNLRAIEFSTA